MKLNLKQTIALDFLEDNTTTQINFGGGAGGSKSVLGCYWLLKSCLKYPGTRWVMGRAIGKTLRETTLNTFFWVAAMQGVTKLFKYNAQKSFILFSNGSEILLKDLELYPSDPNFDELGSLEITGAFVDECNQITKKAWGILFSRIRYKLDENNLIPKQLGTCNPSKNWVYNDFYYPSKMGLLAPNKKFVQALLGDNPDISKHYKDNLLQLDEPSKQRLLYGNWEYDDDPAKLIEYDAIMDIFTNDHVLPTGKKYISADLAMQGRDKFIAGLWDEFICTIAIEQGKSTGKSIETDLKTLMVKNGVSRSRTVVDSDGLGNYLDSYLEGIKTFHGGSSAVTDSDNLESKTEYFNLKSQCGYKLAELINNRKIKIICSDEQKQRIVEELGVLKAKYVDGDENKKRIIGKDDMKELLGRSPDYLDMLLMRMIFVLIKNNYNVYSV